MTGTFRALARDPIRAFCAQRQPSAARVELNRAGLHWDEIHEDISVADLLSAEV
jgi:hypothetical protein